MTFNRKFIVDLAERVIATFIETFSAMLAASALLSVAVIKMAAVAGIASALAVLKGALAKQLGDPTSAALVDTTPPGPTLTVGPGPQQP